MSCCIIMSNLSCFCPNRDWWVALLHGSCSAMRACLRRASKSAPSSKWCRRAFLIWSEHRPLQYLDLNIDFAAATPSGFLTWLSNSSNLHPQTDTDSVGSCLAEKNCSKVLSHGRKSPNLTSNFANTCSTETSEPMAKRTSAALPRRERLMLDKTMASWYKSLLQTLCISQRSQSRFITCLWPSSLLRKSCHHLITTPQPSLVISHDYLVTTLLSLHDQQPQAGVIAKYQSKARPLTRALDYNIL